MGSDTRTHIYTYTQVPMCTILSQIMHVRRSLKNDEKENLHNLPQCEAQHRIKKGV
jgi:hypothetical protein